MHRMNCILTESLSVLFSQEFTKPEVPAPATSTTVNKELLSDLKHEMWNLMKVSDIEILLSRHCLEMQQNFHSLKVKRVSRLISEKDQNV